LKQFTIDHLEVERKHTSPPYFNGIFRCRVLQKGREVFNKWVEINAITGNLGQGTMKSLVDQTSLVNNDICVTHCFYDAPHKGNIAGLPDWDQFYVTVSPNNSSWISIVAPTGSAAAGKPFRRLVLPAAHDVGMNSLHTSEVILQRAGPAFTEVRLFLHVLAAMNSQLAQPRGSPLNYLRLFYSLRVRPPGANLCFRSWNLSHP
jgi:hypothetical protein